MARRTYRSAPKRPMYWKGVVFSTSSQPDVAGGFTPAYLVTVYDDSGTPSSSVIADETATITRMRGVMKASSGANDPEVFCAGIMPVSRKLIESVPLDPNDLTAIDGLPGPLTEPEYPWMWVSGAPIVENILDESVLPIDCKAQRKWSTDDHILAMIVQGYRRSPDVGGKIGGFQGFYRILLKAS